MSKKMTLERAAAFGAAWGSGDADLVASFFSENGVYHASVGPDLMGKTYVGREEVREGSRRFFERFPDGRFENLKITLHDDSGLFEWDFIATGANGHEARTAGCDILAFEGDMFTLKNSFRKVVG